MKEIVLGKRRKKKVKMFDRTKMVEIAQTAETTNGRLELIRALIPLGLKAANDELMEEFERLTGAKHRHDETLTQLRQLCIDTKYFPLEG